MTARAGPGDTPGGLPGRLTLQGLDKENTAATDEEAHG